MFDQFQLLRGKLLECDKTFILVCMLFFPLLAIKAVTTETAVASSIVQPTYADQP